MARLSLGLALALAAFLVLAVPATAQDDPGQAVNQTVEDTDTLLDKTLHGVQDAADGVGDAAQDAGKGAGKAGSAVGDALVAAAKAVGKAVAATAKALGSMSASAARGIAAIGLVSSLGLATGVLAVGDSAAGGLAALGSIAGSGSALAGIAVGSGIAWASGVLSSGVLAYVGLISNLRPDDMPVVAFGAVAVTGATASAGVGSWAGWAALKKWGLMAGGAGGLGVGGFTRIENDDLLEHPLRAQIFQVIQTNPGVHASGLARQVGVGWGTITHHLEKLEKGHLVATRKVNNQKCFFENGGKVSRQDMAIAGAVKGDTAGDIAGFVTSHPMTSQKQMAEALDLSPALVSFHVKKLVNLGVLDKVRHGKETLLTTSESLRRVLAAEQNPAVHAELKDESFQYSS
jgi:DNA-binding transcriptional ArsR family regulator